MPAETDTFVIATCALWAGDFSYFEKLLQEFSPAYSTRTILTGAEAPEDFIRETGALRLRQLWQKRGEFRNLAAEHRDQQTELEEQPLVLETKHLRAVLWRVGDREFVLKAYLKDLSWQQTLFASARREANRGGTPKSTTFRQPQRQPELFESGAPSESMRSPGVSWVVPGRVFIQVELTDLGLIEATGLCVHEMLPDNGESIVEPFRNLLNSLDGQITQ